MVIGAVISLDTVILRRSAVEVSGPLYQRRRAREKEKTELTLYLERYIYRVYVVGITSVLHNSHYLARFNPFNHKSV